MQLRNYDVSGRILWRCARRADAVMGNTFRREHYNVSRGGENGEELDVVIQNRRDSEADGEDDSSAGGHAGPGRRPRALTATSRGGELVVDGPHTDLVEVWRMGCLVYVERSTSAVNLVLKAIRKVVSKAFASLVPRPLGGRPPKSPGTRLSVCQLFV